MKKHKAQNRFLLFIIVLFAGVALVAAGLVRTRGVLPQENKEPNPKAIVLSEPQIIDDITIGGLRLSPAGRLERTYGGSKPASLCPT